MTQRKPNDMSWDGFAEHLIREAQDAGEFDQLPGFGQPLKSLDEPDDELWWVKQKLQRERVSILPPALQAKADVHRALEQLWLLRQESAVRAEVARINELIRQANLSVTWGPPSTLLPLDVEQVVSQWRQRGSSTAPDGAPESA